MSYEIRLTRIPEQVIVCLRDRGPIGELRHRGQRLSEAVASAGLAREGPLMALFFDEEFDPDDCDFDVCLPIAPPAGGSFPDLVGDFPARVIPAHHALVTEHTGPVQGMHAAYRALADEIDALGYAVAGPATEVFVKGPDDVADPREYVTELRRPIAR